MSKQLVTCVVVTCSRCGEVNDDGEESYHFPSLEAVKAQREDLFHDWRWSDEETPDICGSCVGIEACAESGHVFGPWWSCWCKRHLEGPEHTHQCQRMRWCERCRHGESEPLPTESNEPTESGGTEGTGIEER
ncbi:hypothetical protein GCM10010156_76580 [Planobispora rosea]|uniref:Uncharacterized protein n=1 Tax=Planobispora rosea TaxID=35762 RepID=A0A8J3SAQ5_PLARO|nr:hypothetical protein [Planobispora rosea]GGT08185.1 hypothetical protein GCM10010156_76580 [Planobispora rosea]GIH89136.1 hypothetical protein Pro02_75440 [Planobispora rosea]